MNPVRRLGKVRNDPGYVALLEVPERVVRVVVGEVHRHEPVRRGEGTAHARVLRQRFGRGKVLDDVPVAHHGRQVKVAHRANLSSLKVS